MNSRLIGCFLFMFLLNSTYSQHTGDTIFLNKSWKETSARDSVAYYQVIDKTADGRFYMKSYYVSGALHMTGTYTQLTPEKKRIGEQVYYYESGIVSSRAIYGSGGDKEGKSLWYFETGELREERDYIDGKISGWLKTFYKNGQLKRQDKYNAGKLIKGKCYSETGKRVNYYEYEIAAEYPGGLSALQQFLKNNIVYPGELLERGLEAKVVVRFVIEKDGTIGSTKVVNEEKVHPLFIKAALEVVRKMPVWKPGRMDGELVKSYFTLPISFRLQ